MEISELTQSIVDFRDERNWKQFHNPKDLTISLMLEAAEVAERF
jgi:NTP pyrophosphatase (non-canonical NTP hydrolase)